jgi:hypothetical protein
MLDGASATAFENMRQAASDVIKGYPKEKGGLEMIDAAHKERG